jgi:hypothetical protein
MPKYCSKSGYGARQIRHVVAVEQVQPVAGAHLGKVGRGRGERITLRLVRPPGDQHLVLVRLAQRHPVQIVMVGQQMGGVVDEGVASLDGGPQGRGRLQAVAQEVQQPGERLTQPPCPCDVRSVGLLAASRSSRACCTRSSESAIASSRSLSLRPEAASGGRPSSVSALRTARQ